MSKTTFLGYVPSLKSKHEATIVGHKAIKSKGGSIRYTLQGEYDGRKTLPKTVSKADFESVYGFDAKEAEAVIVSGSKDGEPIVRAHKVGQKEKDGFMPSAIAPIEKPQDDISEVAKEFYENHAETVVGSPSPASVEPPAPSESPFPQEPSNENFSAEVTAQPVMWDEYGLEGDNDGRAYGIHFTDGDEVYDVHWFTTAKERDAYMKEYNETEVKEAFGLFGDKDEEEESEEPKTQEFTVVLQEGDKLELTDIAEEEQAAPDEQKEEDSPEESENEEKEADEDMVERTFFITDAWYDTYDETDEDSFEDQYGYNQSDEQPKFEDEDLTLTIDAYPQEGYGEISDSLVDALSNSTGFGVYHFSFVEIMPDGSKKVLEAVQAKVTRPVKEDETEEESEEGLSTGAKVALGVGALAAGVALFGAEEDDYIPYEAETDYTDIYEASGSGEKEHDMIARDEEVMYEFRYDNPITNYDWTTAKETVSDDEEDYIHDAISDEIGSEPSEGDDNFEIDVEDVGSVDVDTYTDYGDKRHYGLAAEHESESDGYAYAYTKGHNDGINDEVIYRPSLTTDKGRNIYRKILKQKAETFGAESHRVFYSVVNTDTGDEIDYGQMVVEAPSMKEALEKAQIMLDENAYEGEEYEVYPNGMRVQAESFGADTVGNPSPSGPSSTPEPAEATGSEPSNENMEAEGYNMKMALGILGVGVGAVALLGGDRIKKLFDRLGL